MECVRSLSPVLKKEVSVWFFFLFLIDIFVRIIDIVRIHDLYECWIDISVDVLYCDNIGEKNCTTQCVGSQLAKSY